jgi:hypothetical protein
MLNFATQGTQNLKAYEAKSVAVNESIAGCLLGSKSRDVNHTCSYMQIQCTEAKKG